MSSVKLEQPLYKVYEVSQNGIHLLLNETPACLCFSQGPFNHLQDSFGSRVVEQALASVAKRSTPTIWKIGGGGRAKDQSQT